MARFDLSACWRLTILGVVLVGVQPTVAQTVVVHDTFDIGAKTFDDDRDDPLDVPWSDGFVVDDMLIPGINDGNALQAGGDVWADFDPVFLEQLDHFVRLSFDFRMDGAVDAGGDSSNGNFLFRIGLTDAPSEKTGYIMRIGTGGDGVTPGTIGNGIGLRQNDDRAGPYTDLVGVPVQNETFSVNDNEPHSASLSLTRITGETTEDGVPTGELEGVRLDATVDDVSVSGDFLFDAAGIIEMVELDHIFFDDRGPDFVLDNVRVEFGVAGPETPVLQAGDADQDFDFDQLDLVKVQIAGTYLSGQPATWGDGDWDGAPGGLPGSPPPGNGRFDQIDIISALAPGHYLTGAYAAVNKDAAAGELSVVGSLEGGGKFADVERIYVPEPSTMPMAILALFVVGRTCRVRRMMTGR